jgi:hypothetical protein
MGVRTKAAFATVTAVLAADQAAATSPRLAVSPAVVKRGSVVRVHGVLAACPRGDEVTLISRAFGGPGSFAGLPAVHARIGAGGAYSVTVRIPRRRRPGRYAITGRCGGGNIGVSVTLRVRTAAAV